MTITLEAIKAEQSKIAAMIAAFEQQPSFPISVPMPDLRDGERHVGAIISVDGSRRYSLILLPGDAERASHKAQVKWAAGIGGELPDRVESALLFATMKDEFKPEWYWTREPHPSDSGFAFVQDFYDGGQGDASPNDSYRARAVRRLPIE